MKRTLLLIALAASSCVTTGNIHRDLPPNPYKALELTTKGAVLFTGRFSNNDKE